METNEEMYKKAIAKAHRTNIITWSILAVILEIIAIIFASGIPNVWPLYILPIGVGGFFWFKDFLRIKRSFCPKCSKNYDYNTDVSWDVDNERSENGKKTATVNFECVCSNCGETKRFSTSFTTAKYIENKGWTTYNIRNNAKQYFWRSSYKNKE